MKALPAEFAAHIKGGITTLCRCWQLRLRDGRVIGFTDHDADVAFDGVEHLATAGFSASADVAHASFAVGGLDLEGAFSSDSLVDVELMAGDYDGAVVELWLVNWQAVDERVLIRRGILGEVTKADEAFRAEVRGPMQALEAIKGRVFTAACDADLGDARCGIDLTDPAFRGEGTVAEAFGPRGVRASGLDGFEAGWFDGGLLAFSGGANSGRRFLVKRHAVEALGVFLDLAGEPLQTIAVDDPFEVTAGCDKRFETCIAKFQNTPNFQGFPHIPGNDVVLNVARSTERNEGRRLR